MQGEKIGSLIETIRTEKNYRQKDVSRGICSAQMLAKIESGERIPDKTLLEYIMHRLDLTTNRMEMIISLEKYKQIELQDGILELLFEEKPEDAKKDLEEYISRYKLTKIQKQFVKRCEAYISILENKSEEDTLKIFIEAINATFPEWQNELGNYLLSTVEVELLINIADYYFKTGQSDSGEGLLVKVGEYVRDNKANECERVKLLPRCAILLSRYLKEKMDSEALLEGLEESYELLRNQGVLYTMAPLLDELNGLYEQLDRQEDAKKVAHQLAAIKEVASNVNMKKVDELLPFYLWPHAKYYIDYEFIREERIVKKMTQEDLAEGIYKNPESLSRVETGKVPPKKTQFYQLMRKIEIDKARYNTIFITNNYKVIDEYDKFTWTMIQRGYAETEELRWLGDMEDTQLVANKQRILFHEIGMKLANKEITVSECLIQLIELLEKTYSFDVYNFRVPMNTEFLILNKIALCFKQLQEYNKAIEIFEHIIKCFKNSSVSERYYKRSIQMTMCNLSDCYEKKSQYDKSLHIMKNCVIEDLKIGRGYKLGNYYSTYIHLKNVCAERDDKVEEFQSSLQLMELYKIEKEKKVLENFCKRISEK